MTFKEGRVEIEYHYGKSNLTSHTTEYDFDEENRKVEFIDRNMDWVYNLTFS